MENTDLCRWKHRFKSSKMTSRIILILMTMTLTATVAPAWVLGKNPFMTIDGYKYAIESDKPTLDDWDVVMEVFTGTTNSDEWGDIAYTDCLREKSVDFEWISCTKVGEYTMLHIPAGSTDKIYSTGTIGGNFTPGKTYGIGFNYKRNGKYLWKENPGRAFKVMWPIFAPAAGPYCNAPGLYWEIPGKFVPL